ncbi:hypothetical protein FRC05_002639 [Tulasnella sp. 425]|nr:hypothetical protein FRC05_002639 [Tulasnella sp. 425]
MPSDLHRPVCFSEIPEELIIAILSLLGVEDILRARRVCRQLHAISRETYLWLQVLQRRVPGDVLAVIQLTCGARVESLALKLARRMMGRGDVKLRAVKTAIEVETCHFIPGARWLITVSGDRTVHAWDSFTEDIKPILLRAAQPVEMVTYTFSALEYTGDSNCILVIGKSKLTSAKSPFARRRLSFPTSGPYYALEVTAVSLYQATTSLGFLTTELVVSNVFDGTNISPANPLAMLPSTSLHPQAL